MLDIRRMRVLQEVLERGSFSAAAESLHLSQSAVSQQVAVLEREVGVPLLERTSDGPKLTTAGATLMTSALSIFRKRFPNVELQFSEDEPEDSFPGLKRGNFDLAVVFDYPAFPLDFSRDVEAEMIYEEPMWVALPPGHPLAAAKSVRIADLADEDWLCGALPSSCREQVLGLGRDAGFEPRISFQSEDYEVIKGFVAAGLGVTILPELAGGHPGIELRAVRGQKPIRRVWAVTREDESRSPAAEEMLSILDRKSTRLNSS